MKYSSTTRLLNIIVFALLTLGFGALAVYFGFMVAPFVWTGKGAPVDIPDLSLALVLMLGCYGLAAATASVIGLINSVRSLLKSSDDKLVRKSFNSYFAVGYITSAAILLNAVWLYRLTTTNLKYDNIGFIVTVYVIAFILVMVATNVPLVKLYGEEENASSSMIVLLQSSFASGFGIAVPFLACFIFAAANGSANAGYKVMVWKFATYAAIPCIGALVALVGVLLQNKADKAGSVKKSPAVLLYSSFGVYGLALIAAGIFSLVYRSTDSKFSLMNAKGVGSWTYWLDTSVMSFIVGGVIVIAAIALVVLTLVSPKRSKRSTSPLGN